MITQVMRWKGHLEPENHLTMIVFDNLKIGKEYYYWPAFIIHLNGKT